MITMGLLLTEMGRRLFRVAVIYRRCMAVQSKTISGQGLGNLSCLTCFQLVQSWRSPFAESFNDLTMLQCSSGFFIWPI